MRLEIMDAWRRIRTSFWFVPALMVVAAVGLAFANLHFDRTITGSREGPLPWLTVAGAASARTLLSTIAGSMITVAGVTFSIVIVALTMASSQFSPRLLTGFMQDTGNQVVLGTFISVFMYCLVVLIHLPGDIGSRRLPQTSLLFAVLLAAVAVGVLIFFFHHISDAIRAGEVVRQAGLTLESAIDATVPEGSDLEEGPWPPRGFSEATARIKASQSGYLSAVHSVRLAEIAEAYDLRIMIEPQAGDFVLGGQTLAWVKPPEALTEAVTESICEACSLVERREDSNDLRLAFESLTEVAVRSLSPGINDPYTALAAVHRLTSGLDVLLERLPARSEICDAAGNARVFVRLVDGQEVLEHVYGPVRTYGRHDARVLEALVRSLASLRHWRRERWDAALSTQVERVLATAEASLELDDDRSRVKRLAPLQDSRHDS